MAGFQKVEGAPGLTVCECGTFATSDTGRDRHTAHFGTVNGKCGKTARDAAIKAAKAARKAAK